MSGLGPIMSPKIRKLMLTVLEGNPTLTPYSAIPPHLFTILQHPYCEEILTGLTERGLIGKQFLHWFVFIHNGNLRTAAKDILSRRAFKKTQDGVVLIS